ncbi:hypothetical protein A2U01_0078860, partial [Trifolium medium]|nr:hypothetical protein [Trifolium medium]
VELEMHKNEQNQGAESCELRLAQALLRAAQLKDQKGVDKSVSCAWRSLYCARRNSNGKIFAEILEAAPGATSSACSAITRKITAGNS